MSTPFGTRGHFYESWQNGGDSWDRISVPATQCPRISKEFLEEERRSMGEWWFEQEYMCQFKESVDSVFSHEVVMAAMSDEIRPLFEVAQ